MDFKLLKVISLLLDYPHDALFEDNNLEACRDIVMASGPISPEVRQHIGELIDEFGNLGAIEAQSRYDGLFERGRTLSLWLFEHVHGESRDRGQAMVDLMAQYESAGFEIDVKELPDYLPMYLEFLAYQATQTDDHIAIRLEIADISHILALLAARLIDKNSKYVSLFEALLQIAGKPLSSIDEELTKMCKMIDDTTPEAIDAEWEEEVVNFMANNDAQCPSSQTAKRISHMASAHTQNQQTQPVHWVDFNQKTKTDSANTTQGVRI